MERAPSCKGALPFYEASEPRLNPVGDRVSLASPRVERPKGNLVAYYFFFFLGAFFFFIARLRIALDLVARLRAFLFTGISTSSPSAATG